MHQQIDGESANQLLLRDTRANNLAAQIVFDMPFIGRHRPNKKYEYSESTSMAESPRQRALH